MALAAYSLAMNTYFHERRGYAMGLGTTAMGLGPVFMPLLISLLLQEYGVQGTMLIVGAMSFNTLVTSCLLQPVKWHLKTIIKPEELTLIGEDKNEKVRKYSEQSNGIGKDINYNYFLMKLKCQVTSLVFNSNIYSNRTSNRTFRITMFYSFIIRCHITNLALLNNLHHFCTITNMQDKTYKKDLKIKISKTMNN